MAFIVSRLDEETQVLVECETTGAFSKSDLEIKPDPERAIFVTVENIASLSRTLAMGIVPTLREVRASNFEVQYGIKIDGNGSVLISQRKEDGQFSVTLRWSVAPQAPARPAGS